ncbi:magnesium transporter MgtE N-terminal domain-containing protein [Bacillus fonticola]|uniref:magnesium transporter MgtE N-terminal domain-containing protein n=1 Tax=Bacillus fonticola TaxID=2728853 RepID=UPI00147601EA|nr:hypothetical protein [Bacillus fonticola]
MVAKPKKKQVMKEEVEVKKKSRGKTFLFLFLFPFLVASAIALVVLTFAGVNVFDTLKSYGSSLPVVGSFLANEEASFTSDDGLQELKARVRDREVLAQQLEGEVADLQEEVTILTEQRDAAQAQAIELRQMQEENKRAFQDVLDTFEEMDGGTAAPILLQMNEEQALAILSNVTIETLADLLESMSAEDAARFTEQITTQARTQP